MPENCKIRNSGIFCKQAIYSPRGSLQWCWHERLDNGLSGKTEVLCGEGSASDCPLAEDAGIILGLENGGGKYAFQRMNRRLNWSI